MPRTPGFDALGFGFRIVTENATLAESLTRLFRCLMSAASPTHAYEVVARARDAGLTYDVTCDGEPIAHGAKPRMVEAVLVHDVTRQAVATGDGVMLHAAGVEHDGVATALVGATDAGKSTLAAGLVRAGMAYLTDEALAIDRQTLQVVPYPKPLSLDPGAWALFPELSASGVLPPADVPGGESQVTPDTLRPGSVGRAAPIGFVVFPRYRANARTRLEPKGRGAALLEATNHTFAFSDRARENLDVLADVMRRASCFDLTVGNLDDAVTRVAALSDADVRERA